MHEERRREPRGEGWGPPWGGRGEPPRRGRAEWGYAMGGPEFGPGGPGGRERGPGAPGRGWGGPRGDWAGSGRGGHRAWAWAGPRGPSSGPPEVRPRVGPRFLGQP